MAKTAAADSSDSASRPKTAMPDVQASADSRQVAIDKVGVAYEQLGIFP